MEHATPPSICLIGPNALLNQLLRGFLTRQLSCTVRCQTSGPPFSSADLLLVDGSTTSATNWLQRLQAMHVSPTVQTVAMFNLPEDWQGAPAAVSHGIKGIFTLATTPEQLVKGIKAILAGELWYSRRALSESLHGAPAPEQVRHNLTQREREILLGIARGSSNKDIANSLGISQHTVKTHIYNIYRKLNVSKRLKAAQWASLHLDD